MAILLAKFCLLKMYTDDLACVRKIVSSLFWKGHLPDFVAG